MKMNCSFSFFIIFIFVLPVFSQSYYTPGQADITTSFNELWQKYSKKSNYQNNEINLLQLELQRRNTPQQSTPPQSTPPQSTPPQSTPPQSTPPQSTPPQSTPPQTTPPPTDSGGDHYTSLCDVCNYVLSNKIQNQPYLCRGLTDISQQKSCVDVLEAMVWYMANVVYWVNYGCPSGGGSQTAPPDALSGAGGRWIRPCPAHVICSWMDHLSLRRGFCPADPQYPRPTS